MNSQRRVLGTAAIVTFGIGFLAGVNRGEDLPTARFLIGTSLAFTICSIMVDLGWGVGAGFAVLIMLASLMYQGEDALMLLGARSKKPKRRPGKRGGGNTVNRQRQQQLDPLGG